MSRILLPLGCLLAAAAVIGWLALRSRAEMREVAREGTLAERTLSAPETPSWATPELVELREELREELSHVRAALERIEARLDRAEREPVVPRAAHDTAPVPTGDSDEHLRLHQELLDAVALLLARSEDPALGLQRLRAERPEADWAALGLLLSLWEVDVEQARKEVQLLSEAELLRRYGAPDLTFPSGEGTRWVYGQGFVPARDAYELQLTFVIQGGLVRSFFVERL